MDVISGSCHSCVINYTNTRANAVVVMNSVRKQDRENPQRHSTSSLRKICFINIHTQTPQRVLAHTLACGAPLSDLYAHAKTHLKRCVATDAATAVAADAFLMMMFAEKNGAHTLWNKII